MDHALSHSIRRALQMPDARSAQLPYSLYHNVGKMQDPNYLDFIFGKKRQFLILSMITFAFLTDFLCSMQEYIFIYSHII